MDLILCKEEGRGVLECKSVLYLDVNVVYI